MGLLVACAIPLRSGPKRDSCPDHATLVIDALRMNGIQRKKHNNCSFFGVEGCCQLLYTVPCPEADGGRSLRALARSHEGLKLAADQFRK